MTLSIWLVSAALTASQNHFVILPTIYNRTQAHFSLNLHFLLSTLLKLAVVGIEIDDIRNIRLLIRQ